MSLLTPGTTSHLHNPRLSLLQLLFHPHVASIANFILLKAVGPLSGPLDQFSHFIKRDQVQQIG